MFGAGAVGAAREPVADGLAGPGEGFVGTAILQYLGVDAGKGLVE